MTTITEVLDLPDGTTPRNVAVYFQLAGTDGAPIAGFVGTTSIVGKVSPKINGAGAYSIDLVGNDDITPSGTRWKRSIVLPSGPNPAPEYLDVPSTGGPYRVDEVLDEAPASVASSALSQEVATRTAQVAALQASLDAITSGADPSLDTFLEAYTRFLADESAASALTTTVAGKVDKSTLTTDGDLYTRAAGAVTRMTRDDLAADPAFTGTFVTLPASPEVGDGLVWDGDAWAKDHTIYETAADHDDEFSVLAVALSTETDRAIAMENAIVANWIAARPLAIRKTGDTNVNSITNEVMDPDLHFAIGANEVWHVHFALHVQCGSLGASSDFKAGLDLPAGCTCRAFLIGPATTATSAAGASQANRTLGSTGASATVGALDGASFLVELKGTITNGATAGIVTLRYAQSVTQVSDTIVTSTSKLFRERLS